MKIGVYAGSFDPVTNGHLDIIKRAAKVFDKIIVGIGVNSKKTPMFSFEERKDMIEKSIIDTMPQIGDRIVVESFDGLLVEFTKRQGAMAIIRGLRNGIDFEYEFAFAHTNTRLAADIEHVYFMTSEKDHFVSSSVVKEIWSLNGNYNSMVPYRVWVGLEGKRTR